MQDIGHFPLIRLIDVESDENLAVAGALLELCPGIVRSIMGQLPKIILC